MPKAPRKTTPRSEPGEGSRELEELREAVDRLEQRVSVLTTVLDQLVDELQWRNNELRERKAPAPPPEALHSMPSDPCDPDWKINRIRRETSSPPKTESKPPRQTLFD